VQHKTARQPLPGERGVSREAGVSRGAASPAARLASQPVVESLERLRERYDLSQAQRDQLAAILRGLVTSDAAPTAVRDPARALDVHLADSLVALELGVVQSARRIADLGSGAGFPGLALALALPVSELALVEAQARRCDFIEGLRAAARVANARVVHSRAEEWFEGLGANDAVLARALGPRAVVVEYAAPLLRVGGVLVDWRGRRDEAQERAAARAAAQVGLELAEVRRVEPYEGAREHRLLVYGKVRETPERFPRRAGMARKRPLGR
jgi:16S rRNA (guanine527-N7)-methyltransferase